MARDLKDTLVQLLEQMEIEFEADAENAVFGFGVEYEHTNFHCALFYEQETEIVCFYSVCPTVTPPERRVAMAELLNRANYGMKIGNFELDMEDGEIRYKTSVDVEGGELTETMFKNLLMASLSTHGRYMPAIQDVVYAKATPEAAINQIENPEAGSGETPTTGNNGAPDHGAEGRSRAPFRRR